MSQSKFISLSINPTRGTKWGMCMDPSLGNKSCYHTWMPPLDQVLPRCMNLKLGLKSGCGTHILHRESNLATVHESCPGGQNLATGQETCLGDQVLPPYVNPALRTKSSHFTSMLSRGQNVGTVPWILLMTRSYILVYELLFITFVLHSFYMRTLINRKL